MFYTEFEPNCEQFENTYSCDYFILLCKMTFGYSLNDNARKSFHEEFMKYWKSALMGTAILAASSAMANGYVEAVQTNNSPVTITTENNSGLNVNVPGLRYEYDGGNITFGYPFSSGGTNTTAPHDGKTYYSIFVPKPPAPDQTLATGGSRIATPNFDPATRDLTNVVPLIKAGGCADPAKPKQSPSIDPNDIASIISNPNFYNPDYKYLDTLGSNGGEFSARWVDTYGDETQIQWAIGGTSSPSAWSGSLSDTVSTRGPMYWMALAAGQELFSMDAQYLMAIGLKETGVGSSEPTAPRMSNAEGAYGAFELEMFTGGDRMLVYPKFYPEYKAALDETFTRVPYDANTFVAIAGESFASIFDRIFGTESFPDRAHMVNSVVMSGLLIYQYYDMIGTASDFCGGLAFSSKAADPYLGLCAIAAHYNLGINGGVPNALKNLTTIDDPNGCNAVPVGNSNYVPAVRSILEALANDQKRWVANDPSVRVIDKTISLAELTTFFWGDGGTKDAPGDNGLMWHFNLDQAAKDAMWTDVTNAFNQLAVNSGGSHISFRYDFLTLLRVAKAYLDTDRPAPTGPSTDAYLSTHSSGTACDVTVTQDEEWPYVNLSGDINGDFEVNGDFYDYETGPLYIQYRLESSANWADANLTSNTGAQTQFNFSIPGDQLNPAGDNVWVRAADSCKNEIAMKIKVEGIKISYLDSAWAVDVDGDGQADQIEFAGRDHEDAPADAEPFANLSAVEYKWPNATTIGNFTAGDASLTVNATGGVINDTNLVGTRALGSQLTVNWSQGTRSTNILDRVGPAILSASVRERTSPTQDDTLYVTFTEPVNALTTLGNPNFLNVDDINQAQTEVFNVSGNTWAFVYTAGIVSEGQFVNILHTSGLTDTEGNTPLANNIKREIILNKGPVPLETDGHGFFDTNLDGKMDRVQLKFKIPLTQPQVDVMRFTVNWLTDDRGEVLNEMQMNGDVWRVDIVDPTIVYYSIPATESIKEDYTYINPEVPGMGAVSVAQLALDPSQGYETQNPVVPDQMGPIIVENNAILIKTARPDIRSDILRVTFTEPIVDQTIANNFIYRVSGADEPYENSLDGHRLINGGKTLLIEFGPNELDRPNIGDSLRIETNSVLPAVIEDLAGNKANEFNPLRLIDGKVIVIFFSPEIAQFNPDIDQASKAANLKAFELWQEPTGQADQVKAQAVFVPGTMTNEEIFAKYGMGFGFSTSFSNKNFPRDSVKFKVSGDIYSNLGGFVAKLNDEFTCEDVANSPGMEGTQGVNACKDDGGFDSFSSATEFKVFYPWNMKSFKGRYVGSGAFFIKMNVKGSATSPSGVSLDVIDEGVLEKTFGIVRGNDSPHRVQVIEPLVTPNDYIME